MPSFIKKTYYRVFICIVIGLSFLVTILVPNVSIANSLEAEAAYDTGDYVRAYELWLPLANKSDTNAVYNIATLYRHGLGVQKNTEAALEWYRRAALLGHSLSQVNLGRLLLKGEGGVKREVNVAISWFQKAATEGDPFGQYYLGRHYLMGFGLPKNYSQAASLFLYSARQGVREAAYELAILYKIGSGVTENQQEALKWFSSAAHAGHLDAQFNVGVIYEEGRGTPINFERAYFWYSVSAANQHPSGMDRRKNLEHKLTRDQIDRVKHNLKNWPHSLP